VALRKVLKTGARGCRTIVIARQKTVLNYKLEEKAVGTLALARAGQAGKDGS